METSPHFICRYSNAVKQHFVVPSPRFAPHKFVSAIIDICVDEKIDFLIPLFEEIILLSKNLDRFPDSTRVLCESYPVLNALHNKWLFQKKISALGLKAPRSYLVRLEEELEDVPLSLPYMLKPSYSRASTKVVKVRSLPLPRLAISRHNPLVAQEYLCGAKYCSYSIAHQGRLSAHVTYPVDCSIKGNSCVNFKAIVHPAIATWVEQFVAHENFTGQIAFDFIETDQNCLYVVECNPRGTGGCIYFNQKMACQRHFWAN